MALFSYLPFAAATFALLLAAASVFHRGRSVATWSFAAGMAALGCDSLFTGLGWRSDSPDEVIAWLSWAFVAKSAAPAAWLTFSLTYSRGDYGRFLTRWRIPLVVLALLPVGLSLGVAKQLIEIAPLDADGAWVLRLGPVAKAVNIVLLVAAVLVLANIEHTFRSAVGTMRWRIKFVALAMAVIFGAHLYVRSQAVLFGRPDPSLGGLESGALVIGCLLLVLAYARAGFSGVDLYPSRVALHSSVTLLLVGGYLFVVGVLAQLVGYLDSADTFQLQTLVVLVGMAVLAVLLLSDRLRHGLHALVGRHFGKAQHDSVRIWRLFSRRLANVKDQAGLGAASVRMTSEVFDALSVSIWILNESEDRFVLTASTDRVSTDAAESPGRDTASNVVVAGLRDMAAPFDLERGTEPWAEELRQLNPASFSNGGSRWCVPVRQGEECLGAIVLADHVGGTPYTTEELDLLACCATQIASVLVNLRLGAEVVRAKELEAFRTMSAFFVHDLKNATSSLNLTLKNMPLHFDDPAFREDALRAIGNTTRRIEGMLARLSAFRARGATAVEVDLAQIVREALDLEELADVELTRDLQPTPPILADREQIRSVVTNLVLNARDALGSGGRIDVHTAQSGNWAMLSVMDNGCGMSPEFVRDSLFRPFQSTKQHGLGIGLFQLRTIVLAHGGSVQVDSEPGHGTTFRVTLPLKAQT